MSKENEQDEEIIRAAMSLLGSRTSAKKKRSSRRNAFKSRGVPRRKRKKELVGKKVKNLADVSMPDKTNNQKADHNAQRRIKRKRVAA